MAIRMTANAMRNIRTLCESGTVAGLTDSELLGRFTAGRAEAAFAALVERHGPMVWSVCRRTIGDVQEAEDAFQTTFLILVRKAGTVRVDDSLGRWLYGVACLVARRSRADAARRRSLSSGPSRGAPADPVREAERYELRTAVYEELGRIPRRYREPIELCYLQGLTNSEAARRLGWPIGTVKSRLDVGRRKLRVLLSRRGLTPATAGLTAALTEGAIAAVPLALKRATVRAAALSAAGGVRAFPASVVALVNGAMRAMILSKLRLIAVAAAIGLGASGAGVYAFQQAGPTAGGDGTVAGEGDLPASKVARSSASDGTCREIQEVARNVQAFLDQGRRAEAQDAVHRLGGLVMDWEVSIRSGRGTAEQAIPEHERRAETQDGTRRAEKKTATPFSRRGLIINEPVGSLYSSSPHIPKLRSSSRIISPRREKVESPGAAPVPNTDNDRRIQDLERRVEELTKLLGKAKE